jgi:hypothetical protein
MTIKLCLLWSAFFVVAVFSADATNPAYDRAFNAHRFAKHYMYGTLTGRAAENVLKGTEQPLLKFTVLDDPQSMFVNYEIKPDRLDDLIRFLKLPHGFNLVPMAILEGEPARYYITLNIYAVDALQGLLSGLRAEWSVYVSKDGGRASYMIVDAKHNKFSLDAVNWFSPGTKLEHVRKADALSSHVASDNGTYFQSRVSDAGLRTAGKVYPEVAWISANDRIYWRNGVADRAYYDGEFVDVPILNIDLSAFTFTDTTVWRQFVEPAPVSVLAYETGFDLVVSPWYNVDPP